MRKSFIVFLTLVTLVVFPFSGMCAEPITYASTAVPMPFPNSNFELGNQPTSTLANNLGWYSNYWGDPTGGTAGTIRRVATVDGASTASGSIGSKIMKIRDNSSDYALSLTSALIPVYQNNFDSLYTLKFDSLKETSAIAGVPVAIKVYGEDGITNILSSATPQIPCATSNTTTVWTTSTSTFNLKTASYDTTNGKSYLDARYIAVFIYTSKATLTQGAFFDNFVLTHSGTRTINPAVVKDNVGNELLQLRQEDAGTAVSANVYISDSVNEDYPVTVVIALYSRNNDLLALSIANNSTVLGGTGGNNTVTATLNIPLGDIDGKYIKAMVWKNLGSINPLFSLQTIY